MYPQMVHSGDVPAHAHPRTLRWLGTTALAIGGSNQSLYLLPSLLLGQASIPGQGSAAIPLLVVGLLLGWAALPGWIELVMLSPDRVGGIASSCTDAFRPYSSLISAIVGCCYWWGWVPICGFAAIVAATAIHDALLPMVPMVAIAIAIVVLFHGISLCGVNVTSRVAIPIGIVSAALTFVVVLAPIVAGRVDWHLATTFTLTTPFAGWFGNVTSLMAGLYLIGFSAPAFEAAACHVGETIDPARNVPRAMFASAGLAGLYFIALPVVLLGVLGPTALGGDLAVELGPRYAPIIGSLGKALAVGFIVFNMLHGALQPLAGASRTLAQLADDGVFPRFLSRRSAADVPWAATTVTTVAAVGMLVIGEPIWLIAAANFTYLIAIGLSSVAVFLLRRDAPERPRAYRAPPGTIRLGIVAAAIWFATAVLGFEQFGLATVILGLGFAYSGAALYAWRRIEDHRRVGKRGLPHSLHTRLTQVMIAILAFDGTGYYFAIRNIPNVDAALVAALADIFVVVALLTISAGIVLPGLIANAATRDLEQINSSLHEGKIALEDEISVRRGAEQKLHHIAFHDELTGLANRSHFMQRLAATIEYARQKPDHRAAVLFLDLDRFKIVNDSLGHHAGDLLLIAVAARLSENLRQGDTLARFGGDEFTFLIDNLIGDADHAASVFADRMLEKLAPPFRILDREIFVTACVGISIVHHDTSISADLLRDADIAMYRAKSLGRHRSEHFKPEFLERALRLLEIENDLKGALERHEFVLHYQPIVNLATNQLVAFEALIRWEHPERGLLPPSAFIASAEESDAIVAIGAFVFEEAARQARIWRDRFESDPPISISVNVSARQFSKPSLLEEIRVAVARHDLAPSYLHLEITESAIMEHAEIAISTLGAIRDLGMDIHLDDFGTGYSSLGYLQQFPVSVLKIDRSFVSCNGPGVGNVQIVEMIASLARSLSIETTAEGIETQEQLDMLRNLGCTNGQGYFIARPMDARVATDAIAAWPRTTASRRAILSAAKSSTLSYEAGLRLPPPCGNSGGRTKTKPIVGT